MFPTVQSGRCLSIVKQHEQPITAAAWAPDGESFVTASLDNTSQLCHWNIRGQRLHLWAPGFRVQDCAVSSDGRRLIAAEAEAKIHVYNLFTYKEDYCLPLSSKPTSIVISQDSRHMLINLAEGEIQLVDMETAAVVRRFKGHKQGEFVIRSTFGGAAENFIVSGSEGEYLKWLVSYIVANNTQTPKSMFGTKKTENLSRLSRATLQGA